MRDKFGHTLLTYAIEGGRRKMVSYLISRGAVSNPSDYFVTIRHIKISKKKHKLGTCNLIPESENLT